MSKDVLKIEVENIQAISKAGIEVEGFTGLVGRSNIGKSALLRGTHAAITNKHSKAIFRNGTKKSSVKLSDGKGLDLEWQKGSGVNAYILNGEPYTKVGKDRPEKLDEWGFKDVRINGEALEVQFARQITGNLFLIERSGSFVADFISHITKVDVITGSLKDCEGDLRKANGSVKSCEEEILKLGEEVSKFNDLDYHGTIIKALLETKTAAHEKEKNISDLDAMLVEKDKLVSTYKTLKELPSVVTVSFDIEELKKIEAWVAEIDTDKKAFLRIKEVDGCSVPEIDFDVTIIKDIDECLELQKQVDVVLPAVSPFQADTTEIKELATYEKEYDDLSAETKDVERQVESLSVKEIELEHEAREIEKTLGNCPFCKRGFGHDHVSHAGGLDAVQ